MEYRVVVAEDEPLLLHYIIKKIEELDLGFKVIGSAQTGIQAYELIASSMPDVLITDIRMPVMNGLQLIEKVRNLNPDIDCIILSGYSEFDYARQAIHLQVTEYLLKPVNIKALRTTFQKLKEKYEKSQAEIEESLPETIPAGGENPVQMHARLVHDYIDSHYTETVNFNLLAQKLNYSPSYLTRIFTAAYDTSPAKYLIGLRMKKAMDLLRNHPELSVHDVGERTGYPDQSYFSKAFKHYTGMSPQKYREGE
ncbi:MAG: response regulator [Eubacterium sp.]|nr:response regulator [Eubacterium sp.]